MVPIAIGPAEREQIYAHARRAFPAECCGYLIGATECLVDGVVECRNAQEDGEHPARGADRGFVIAGRELLAFAKSFDGSQPARVVYHSHTNGRAYFSDVDQALARGPAYPVQHLVVGVTAERVTETAQFAWSADVAAYVEIARWTVEDTRGHS
ncbi:MAG: Mov34/MPN/PAD-1 family protein [Myxococcota bacterium]|nr:Mov34/MPN/PAD-1 family protein [Myxococcota bacterium]